MELKPGMVSWIPCEVKPGPFSNERAVRINSLDEGWIGFVDVQFLKHPIAQGATAVQGYVLAVEDDRYVARVSGHSVGSHKVFSGDPGTVTFDPVPA